LSSLAGAFSSGGAGGAVQNAQCVAPDALSGRTKATKLILASSGRVGSTMLAEVLSRQGVRVDHTHYSAERIAADQQKKGTSTPVLYVFGEPVDVILSLRQRDLDTGDSFFGKNISWVSCRPSLPRWNPTPPRRPLPTPWV